MSLLQADQLLRFAFEGMPVRGAMVSLGDAWHAIRDRNPAPPSADSLLGEAVAAVALMFSNIKLRGQIALQLQGDAPVRLLLAQCTSQGELRAIISLADGLSGHEDFATLTHGAHLAITVEQYDNNRRYQGIVSLGSGSLAAGLEGYFRQSEQLPTRIWLAADGAHAAGMMLQQMPGEAADLDGWQRVVTLADTLTVEELLAIDPRQVLHRLYHREHVALFEPQALKFGCRCSRERVVEVLQSLGPDQVCGATGEDGDLEVSCEFCNETYRFDRVDLGELFSDSGTSPESSRSYQ